MKKVVYLSVSIIFVMIAAVFLLRDYIGLVFVSYFLEPKHDFVEKPVPAAPEYRNPDHWAALPERQDFADVRVDSVRQRDVASCSQAVLANGERPC